MNSGHPLSHPRSPRVRSATSSRALSRSPALRQPAPPTCVGLCFPRPSRSLKGTRCTHLSNCMRYRDPARRAVWMRECRKRKRTAQRSALVLRASSPSIVRAPDPSRVPRRIIKSPEPQPARPNTGFARKGARSSFKTALDRRGLFLSECSLPLHARIAMTQASVRPAHGAAIVDGESDEIAPLARSPMVRRQRN